MWKCNCSCSQGSVLYQKSRVERRALQDTSLSIAPLLASKFSASGFRIESNGFGVWVHTVTQVEKHRNIGPYMTIQKAHTCRYTHTRAHTQCVKSPTEVQYIPHKPIKGASYNSLSQNTESGKWEQNRLRERDTESRRAMCSKLKLILAGRSRLRFIPGWIFMLF